MQDFEISVQAAYVIYNQSANVVIILAVSKKVSSLASDDQMAPPFGNLPPLKRWAKLFTLCLFVRIFLLLALKANAAAAFVCCGSILILYVLLLHKYKRAEIEQVSCLEILPCPAAVW